MEMFAFLLFERWWWRHCSAARGVQDTVHPLEWLLGVITKLQSQWLISLSVKSETFMMSLKEPQAADALYQCLCLCKDCYHVNI